MNLLWILARTAGLASVVLLSAVVVLGILGAGNFGSSRWPRVFTQGLHRRVAYIASAMLGLHLFAVVLDSYVDVSLLNVAIPFSSSYERFGVGLGALTIDIFIVLMATSLLRSHMSYYAWQVVHVLAYVAWPVAILHGILSGTDDLVTLGLSLAGALAVSVAAMIRVFATSTKPAAPKPGPAPSVPITHTQPVGGRPR